MIELVYHVTLTISISLLLLACVRQNNQSEETVSLDTASFSVDNSVPHYIENGQDQKTPSPHETQLRKALNDPNIDHYFKDVYYQEKLIIVEDNKMLSITDSLFSSNPDNSLFYFIVFTRSMNGADGFYGEALGNTAFHFITTNTEQFANYFQNEPRLTDSDLENWSNEIAGEITISRENEEMAAFLELEKKLLENIHELKREYTIVIENLLEKIKVATHSYLQ